MTTFRKQAAEAVEGLSETVHAGSPRGVSEFTCYAPVSDAADAASGVWEPQLQALLNLIPARDKLSFYEQRQNYHVCERGCSYVGGLCSYHDTIQKIKRGLGVQD